MELPGLKSTTFQKFNMLKEFDSVDPESDHYWNEKVNRSSNPKHIQKLIGSGEKGLEAV